MNDNNITITDLFNHANEFTPANKRHYYNIVADFTNVAKEKREAELDNLKKKLSTKEINAILDEFSPNDWILSTTISKIYNPYRHLDTLLKFTPKQRTILCIKKLKKMKQKQADLWDKFVSQYDEKSIEKEITNFNNLKKRTPLDNHYNTKITHLLLAIREIIKWSSSIPKKHIIVWVFGLLADKDQTIKLYHLSDTIRDWDTAQRRIQSHYNILEKKYWVNVSVEFHGSTPWRSFQTWAQAVQIISQSSELALEKHELKTCPKLFLMVNNASRSKHINKKKAQWSECLWARVQDSKSKVVHEIVWVDNDVFSVFKDSILELFVVEWIPWDKHYSNLSKWSQFRSMHNFPYVQFLNAISEGWCPPWFRVKKIEIDEFIPDLIIKENEVMLIDPDHYWNGKSLSSHKNWIFWICKAIWAKPDKDKIIWDFFHPDTWEKISSIEFVATEYLWKHTWKKCIWNGSSKTMNGGVFIELWISKEKPEDIVPEVVDAPIWTRVVFRKG